MDSIESIIANAVSKWSEYPKITSEIITKGYFTTVVREETVHKFDGSGILRPVHKDYCYIDFTKKITFNQQEFMSHTKYLHQLFNSIHKWYKC